MLDRLAIRLELSRDGEGWDPRALPQAAQRYLLRVDGGPPKPTAPFPWDEARQRDLATLASADAERRARLGEQLAGALGAAWELLGQRILDALRADQDVVLTLALHAAELFLLPWELLRLPDGTPLGERDRLLLRLAWAEVRPAALRTTAQGRLDPRLAEGDVLFAWAGDVPHEAHQEALSEACDAGFRGLRTLPELTAKSLVAALGTAPPVSILHLLVHGGGAGLHLADAVVPPDHLAARLAPFADRVRLVVLCACQSAKAAGLGSALGSVAEALHRVGFEAVLAPRDPLSKLGSIQLTQALYPPLLADLTSLERATLAARADLSPADRSALQLWAQGAPDTRPLTHRPYRGLEVFDRAHRRFFFGREDEAQEALDKLDGLYAAAKPRLLLVSGASGSGKSSLVRAAVVPRLAERFAAVHVSRPTEGLDGLPPERPLLLVMDQAEELFTALDAEARQALVTQLHALATDGPHSAVILTLRVDFLGRTGELILPDGQRLDQLAYVEAHRVFVATMTRPQMLEVIEGPARLVGLPIQDGLAEQLVDEVAGEPGALPLLEFALDRLWLEQAPGEGLTLAHYKALGGAVGALLEREANALIQSLSEEERSEARRLLVQLVSTGEGQRSDTRRARQRAELGGGEAFESVLNRFADARLVVTGEGGRVEIAHEELIRRWGTLRAWVDADRQKWIEIERVRSWTHGLRGGQLDRAKEARARYGAELGEATLTHIAESEAAVAAEAAREEERQAELEAAKEAAELQARAAAKQAKRATTFSWMAGSGGVIAAMIAALAGSLWQETEHLNGETERLLQQANANLEVAESEGCRARNALRMSAANANREGDPALAMLFLDDLEGCAASPDGGAPPGLAALAKDLLVEGPAPLLWEAPRANRWAAIAVSPDGLRFAAARSEHVHLWSTETLAPLASAAVSSSAAELRGGHVRSLTFSPNGEELWALVGWSGQGIQWSVDLLAADTLSFKGTLASGLEGRAPELLLAPDGSRLLLYVGSQVQLWDTEARARVGAPVDTQETGFDWADFSSDGSMFVVIRPNGEAQIFSAQTGAPLGASMRASSSGAGSPSPRLSVVVFADQDALLVAGDTEGGLHRVPVTALLSAPADTSAPATPSGYTGCSPDTLPERTYYNRQQNCRVQTIASSPGSDRYIAASVHGEMTINRLAPTGPARDPKLTSDGYIRALMFAPDPSRFYLISDGLLLSRALTGRTDPVSVVKQPSHRVDSAIPIPGGQRVLTVSNEGTLRLHELLEGLPIDGSAVDDVVDDARALDAVRENVRGCLMAQHRVEFLHEGIETALASYNTCRRTRAHVTQTLTSDPIDQK